MSSVFSWRSVGNLYPEAVDLWPMKTIGSLNGLESCHQIAKFAYSELKVRIMRTVHVRVQVYTVHKSTLYMGFALQGWYGTQIYFFFRSALCTREGEKTLCLHPLKVLDIMNDYVDLEQLRSCLLSTWLLSMVYLCRALLSFTRVHLNQHSSELSGGSAKFLSRSIRRLDL